MCYTEQQFRVIGNIYQGTASKPELLSLSCAQAYQQALSGHYDAAISALIAADPVQYKTVRMNNVHLGFANLVRLKRAIHRSVYPLSRKNHGLADWYRNELFASERLLRQLRPLRGIAEPDIAFDIQILEVESLQRQGNLGMAFDKVQELFDETKSCNSSGRPPSCNPLYPLVHRWLTLTDHSNLIRLLILKANLWSRARRPSKGFSVALRAACSAYTRHFMPLVWEAVAALATILIDLSEFEGSRALIESIMPHVSLPCLLILIDLADVCQALEGADTYLVGNLYSLLTDAHVGLAGVSAAAANNKDRDQLLNTALVQLDRAKQGMLLTFL